MFQFLKEYEIYHSLSHLLKEAKGLEKAPSEMNRNMEGKVKGCDRYISSFYYIKAYNKCN